MIVTAAAVLVSSCSRLSVTSEPAGAAVLWSPNGYDSWQPWPPRAWDEKGVPPEDGGKAPTTPLRETGVYGDTVWVTVEKPGYYRPLPKAAQLYALQNATLEFSLEETPEALAARMRTDGFVSWKGEWVRPEEHDLVEYGGVWMAQSQAHRLSQIAAGMVEYEGEWLTKDQAAARFEAKQLAQGLVLFKDRWVAPEAKAEEEAIDESVAGYRASNPQPLDLPKVVGPVEGTIAQIQLLNSTDRQVRVMMSGPQSREFILTPYSSVGLAANERVRILPGRYEVVVVPERTLAESSAQHEDSELVALRESAEPRYLEVALAEGFQYLINYDIKSAFGDGPMGDYQAVEPKFPIEAPVIEIPEFEMPERPQRGRGPGAGGTPGAFTPGAGGAGRQRPAGVGGESSTPGAGREGGGQRPSTGTEGGSGRAQEAPAAQPDGESTAKPDAAAKSDS